MAACHVAHDCVVGNNVVIANAVLLAGHVHIGDNCFLGGSAGFHQFVRVGEGAIVSGGARIAQDVPPFAMAAERNEVIGLNLIGLKRRGVVREAMRELKAAFRVVYFTPGNIREIATQAVASGGFRTAEARRFLEFFVSGKRGFARARREGTAEQLGAEP
jgi:UDP-N-acetylglucosamine acyltransferase